MAVPKKKKSKSKTAMHRANKGLKAESLQECANCGEKTRPHNVCPACGFYAGKEVAPKKRKAKTADNAEK